MQVAVLLVDDENDWFAQGTEYDYCASGATREEALDNFVKGFRLMIKLHMEKWGDLTRIKQPTSEAIQNAEEGALSKTIEEVDI